MGDEYYMKLALKEAENAFSKGEIPIGAVVVCRERIVAKAHNMTEQLSDFTAHAEMLAFTSASETLGGKYLNECTLYVTLEPCTMCAGAASWTQMGRIVYGASDPKRGFSNFSPSILSNKTDVIGGILEADCLNLIQSFFRAKRTK